MHGKRTLRSLSGKWLYFFERGCSTGMQDKLPTLKANIYGLTKLWRNFEYMLNLYKEILILKQYLTL